MSQEMRQKANRDTCAGLLRQAQDELTKLHQDMQDVPWGIAQAMKLVEKAQKLAAAQPVLGTRKQPAQVRAKLARAAKVLQRLEADIRAVPVTGVERDRATKRSRDGRKRAERILATSPVSIAPTKPKRTPKGAKP